MATQIKNVLFGKLAVSTRFITEEQLQECLDFQKEIEERGEAPPRLGEILEQKGYLTKQQIQSILETMSSMQRRRFGEIAVAFHFITLEQLETCLDIQKLLTSPQETVPLFGQALITYRNFLKQVLGGGTHPKIGEILTSMGYMRVHQVDAVLEEQNKRIVRCKSCEASLNISRFTPGQKIKCGQCNAVLEIIKVEGSEDLDVSLPPDESAGAESAAAEGEPAEGAPPPADEGLQPMDPATALQEVEKELVARRTSQEVKPAPRRGAGQIADFRVVTRLGQDATGVIFKAMQISKQRPVALKVMNPSVMNDKNFQKRFVDEAKKVASLDHPNIKKVYSLGKADSRFYIAMEFVEGESVYNILEKQGKFHFETAINIGVQLAEALQYAQGQGLIHGDVRPSNILILKDGTVKLANLGLATKITENILAISRSGQMAPFYIAPECVTGDREMDHRTDIYSLGATLFHMIAGRPPFQGQSPFEVLVRLTEETIPPLKFFDPAIPDSVCRIVERMLEAEPQERYQSYEDLLADLRAIQSPGPAPKEGALPSAKARAAVPTHETAKQEYEVRAAHAVRMRTVKQVAILVVAVAAIGLGISFMTQHQDNEERHSAYNDLKTKSLKAKRTPQEFDSARQQLRQFADTYPGTEEAADADTVIAQLKLLADSAREDELKAMLGSADESARLFRFQEARDKLTTGAWWAKTDAPLAAKANELDALAKKRWEEVDAKTRELAESGKYESALSEMDACFKEMGLEEYGSKMQELKEYVSSVKQKRQQEEALAEAKRKERESLALIEKDFEQVDKLVTRLEMTAAFQVLVTTKTKVLPMHGQIVQDRIDLLGMIQDLKNSAIVEITRQYTDNLGAKDDKRLVYRVGGASYWAVKADEGGISFQDKQSSPNTVQVDWVKMDSQLLYTALDQAVLKNPASRFHLALGIVCVLRSETAAPDWRTWLMGKAEDRLEDATAAGLGAQAAPYQEKVRKYFDDTQGERLARIDKLANQSSWDDAKLEMRRFRNEFEAQQRPYYVKHKEEIEALQERIFVAGAAAGTYEWLHGDGAAWGRFQPGPGWKTGAGTVLGTGKGDALDLSMPGLSEVSFYFRYTKKEFTFQVSMGRFVMKMVPSQPRLDVYLKTEANPMASLKQLKQAFEGMQKAGEWHLMQFRVTQNGATAITLSIDGQQLAELTPEEWPDALQFSIAGVSQTQAGTIELDDVFVRGK